jgi:HSP20 family protein
MKTTTQREVRGNVEREVEYLAPEVNIFESKDGYVLEAEMPGVNKDGLEITLEDNQMTLLGRRHLNSMPGEAVFRESRDAEYKRVFALDPAIDTGKITARMEQGVLTLTLPKSERVKPRKITVN